MNSAPEFHAYGCAHLTVIFLTVGLPFLLALIVHRTKSRLLERSICFAISALLLINYVAYLIVARDFGVTTWYRMLPLQLCDWAMAVIIVALWTGNRRNASGNYYSKFALWLSRPPFHQFLRRAFWDHYRNRLPDADLRIPPARDRRFAHICLDGNVFRRRIHDRFADRRELRVSAPQTGGSFAPEFSV